jgi:predicted AlkP superfamily pyrophosphatase or phosphodiesterase
VIQFKVCFQRKLLVWVMSAIAVSAVNAAEPRPVLLISVDGMRPDQVIHAADHEIVVPVLERFMVEGSYAEGVTGASPAVTYPNHTTLVTGVSPAEHGIYGNGPFDPELKNNGGWYWYSKDVRVPTLWQAASQAGLVTASVSWPVTVAAPGIRYNLPEYGVESTDRVKALEAVARPDDLLTDLESALGPYTGEGTESGDRVRTRFAIEIMKRYRPTFITVHLLSVDHFAHQHGPFSAEVRHALATVDGLVGELRAAMLGNRPDAVVAVVSDHGFSATEHVLNLRIPLIEAGLITLAEPPKPGKTPSVRSWEANMANAGGAAAIYLKDPENPALRDRVGALLKQLQADPENGIQRVLGPGDLDKWGAWPGASYIVDMRSDYFISSDYVGPLLTDAPSSGQHGYLADRPEMKASFFIMGRGIVRGRDLGSIDMRQIAPTIAKILTVKLPTAKERPLPVDEGSR